MNDTDARAYRALVDVIDVEAVKPLYRWKTWLNIQIKKGLTHSEIADVCGVSRWTIVDWVSKFDLQQREYNQSKPYHDPEVLRKLYHEEGLSQAQIGDKFDVSKNTISKWMSKSGVDADKHPQKKTYAPIHMMSDGYMHWKSYHRGSQETAFVHRLVAVAEHGVDAVAGMDVHHKNGVPWDNRPENLEVLSHAEHTRKHNMEKYNE